MASELKPGEREAFIAHFEPLQPLWAFGDDGTGGFHNQCTEWAWIGWQARALSSPNNHTSSPTEGGSLTNTKPTKEEREAFEAAMRELYSIGTEVQCGVCQAIKVVGQRGCDHHNCPCNDERCSHAQ